MRACASCGFENAEEGKSCPLCGASEVRATLLADGATLSYPGDRPAAGPAAAAGKLYGDRYRVEGLLGRGGMGQVFRVRDLREGCDCALKVLHPLADDDPDRVERFKREIGILSKIRHPAVPQILDYGTSGAEMFFVSELVDGHDLKVDIQARGAWAPADAAGLGATVADALDAAHALGIVHRDVKPNNIMLGKNGAVRLLDFGLARGVGIDMTSLTRTGMILGTPGYMSPEQFEGRGVDERTDVYSLGIVLFEMLTARLPFTGRTPLAVAMKHKTEMPPAPRSLKPDVPAWLDRVCLRCLEKDPSERFGSAAELARELRRSHGSRQVRRLPGGDAVIEDDYDSSWALVLTSPAEKTGWGSGMTLRFDDRYYKLRAAVAPELGSDRWTYRFGAWPEGEVFRRLVDYAEDCAARAEDTTPSIKSRLQKWISGKK